ncbi:MAG TPA: bifunctional ornithine acetyltransferase/N-acetylglutamate synthase [Polyangia bacterium]
MASTNLRFSSAADQRRFLESQATLPRGFRVGTTRFAFTPVEVAKPAKMTLTVVALDQPTPDFAAVFTRNAICGAPVTIGRTRLEQPTLGALLVNNKISNVGAPDGIARAERLCASVASGLGIDARQVLPASTGVIGWQLPVDDMLAALPAALGALSSASALPAAEGIMTTDLYPKLRRIAVGDGPNAGSIVGFAKGAGMIEPNLATMLVFLLTDLAVPRAALRALLPAAVDKTFNRISIDSDTSTSDSVALLSSGRIPCPDQARFAAALEAICADLAEDVVRNGEGVHHVIRVNVQRAPSETVARAIGKGIVNSPLCKTAICGNDPNVGRLLAALGKQVSLHAPGLDLARLRVNVGGETVFAEGSFRLSAEVEQRLVEHLRATELYASVVPADGVYQPPVKYPPHEDAVAIDIDLGAGAAGSSVLGSDLSHEYVSENADYRS